MSLRKPSGKVEWSSDFTNWNDISSDLLDLEAHIEDLSLGPWNFTLKLKSRNAKYCTTFPSVDGEKGLHYGFRFTINGKLIGIFRANALTPLFNEEVGDLFYVAGVGLGQEAFGKKCYPDLYPRYKADHIIYDQIGHVGLVDCGNLSDSFTAARDTVMILPTGKPTLRDLIVGLEEDIGYSSYFDSTVKPAPLKFFAKTDTTKKLSLILKNILRDNTNNILRGSEPRTTLTLRNYLTLEDYLDASVYFKTSIPNDEDAWTEALTNIFGIHWGVDVGVLTTDTGTKVAGTCSIKCAASNYDLPTMFLVPANSMYGLAFNPDLEEVDRINFMWRNTVTDPEAAPRIKLYDDQTPQKSIYYDFTKSDDAWSGRAIAVGAANIGIWSGDTGTFNWNIAKIEFSNQAVHNGSKTIWVDEFYFYLSTGYSDTILQNATSVTDYGRRDLEVPLPAGYPFLNMWQYGTDLLAKHKEPSRTFEPTCKLDPAKIYEDDAVTAASLLPGWLLQVDVPRLGLELVANGGCWWRILKTDYYLNTLPTGGLTIGFMLMSTEAESPEDYSVLNASRLVSMKDPLRGAVMRLNSQDRTRARQLSGIGW